MNDLSLKSKKQLDVKIGNILSISKKSLISINIVMLALVSPVAFHVISGSIAGDKDVYLFVSEQDSILNYLFMTSLFLFLLQAAFGACTMLIVHNMRNNFRLRH